MPDLQKFSEVLNAFPQPQHQGESMKTFLEIAGYPHRENPASNILRFFLDPHETHGLKTLFFEALLESADQAFTTMDLDVKSPVEREVWFETGERLDLVVSTSTLLVGIENKLYNDPNNDFLSYAEHLQLKAGKRRLICILLSLLPIADSPEFGSFKPVTYQKFFKKLKEHLANRDVEANQRYMPFLNDFIETIEHLRQEVNMPDPEFHTWLDEHQTDVNLLLAEIDNYRAYLGIQIIALKKIIDISKYNSDKIEIIGGDYGDRNDGPKIYHTLEYEINMFDGLNFLLGITLFTNDWKLEIYASSRTSSWASIVEFFNNLPFDAQYRVFPDNILIEPTYDFNTDLSIIAARGQEIIDAIVAAAESGQKGAA